jgi:hypothetical protein
LEQEDQPRWRRGWEKGEGGGGDGQGGRAGWLADDEGEEDLVRNRTATADKGTTDRPSGRAEGGGEFFLFLVQIQNIFQI